MRTYIQSVDLDSTGNQTLHPLYLLYLANNTGNPEGIQIPLLAQEDTISNVQELWTAAPWLPTQSGEELCNLVGSWRILQRVGSHRWTTDDLVTAYMAKVATQSLVTDRRELNYLDLGCGNGSVLQMVLWSLLDHVDIQAFGIEARVEAVELARRSLVFNVGNSEAPSSLGRLSCKATIVHQDFRSLLMDTLVDDKDIQTIKSIKFHLITGTPPYFRVDFSSHGESTEQEGVEPKAIINQGGMPTSIQSAPARCEFRGGIEAYCEVASSLLSDDGILVVCENWLNVQRVYTSAFRQGLAIAHVLPVKGKEGRKENLFGVFVLHKIKAMNPWPEQESFSSAPELDPLVVRTKTGNWTAEYSHLLETMSIPTIFHQIKKS
jgi:tRNA1(Val) A37 N6-methylase TrmN6